MNEDTLEKWIDKFEGSRFYRHRTKQSRPDCLKNILCECGRRSCPCYEVSITTYVRKLKAIE